MLGFSHETHEVVDVWQVSDRITAMDCVSFEDSGTVFALGTTSGKVFVKMDWEEAARWYEHCKGQINDLKFSSDTSCLVCAANDSFVYVFFQSNGSYFEAPPKKLDFEGEVPVCLDFVDDCKAFIAGTSLKLD